MIRAGCHSSPNVQKRLIYVKYGEPQTFYQGCCVGSNSGGVLVTIPYVKGKELGCEDFGSLEVSGEQLSLLVHSTVSTCLFADDSSVLSQGVQLNYTIKTVQHFLDKLETWLTHWRIAINVDKSQAIVFRKWGVIDPPFQLSLFDDNIQWVPVVKYLGLHIDSRLTFKKHIDYLSEKFWGRISLAISLVGRRSPLSLENKVILYKQILRPVITYGSPVWGAAAATHMKKIQVMQNKILRVMTNAPWYVRNDVIHNDLQMEPISNYITKLSRNVFKSIESHDNPIIKAQTLFTYPHPKIKYSYSSTKWRNPLRPHNSTIKHSFHTLNNIY
ncbi:RNA-directed DNA polymerase from mobile element jockey [Trichonephila clavipes]|nr:RNA-directed DNA polymerase from mobile element jockey [Trichonephila clavipes]